MHKLIKNIKTLVQVGKLTVPLRGKSMATLPTINNAFLSIENGQIAGFGTMENCPENADEIIDATEKMVFPCWCDSHTHLVYAANREREFVDRIKGLTYQEIAQRGGGILNSARRLRDTPEEVLLENAYERLQEVIRYGTGAIEIKSGYGLTLESELKMLRVIRQLKEMTDVTVKATFLGAHALPPEYKDNRTAYIDLIVNEMLPRIAGEDLADYCDVFCEKVAFTPRETERIIAAGQECGLRSKIHTNQFNCMGGIQAAIKHKALSVDHLEVVNDDEITCLQNAPNTIATLLPSAPFFINDHYPPARKLIDADIPIALATDFNPGSSPSGNMSFVVSLACIKMRMTPEEAINAATINGAYAIEAEHRLGSISIGKQANIFITKKISSIAQLPYSFGSDLIETVFIKGEKI